MSRNRKKARATKPPAPPKRSNSLSDVVTSVAIAPSFDASARYTQACTLAARGQHDEARRLYADWQRSTTTTGSDARLRALVHNDLAVMAATDGRLDEARTQWQTALEIDRDCLLARLNRDLVEAEVSMRQTTGEPVELELVPPPMPKVGPPSARSLRWSSAFRRRVG